MPYVWFYSWKRMSLLSLPPLTVDVHRQTVTKRWWTIHYRHYLHHRYCINFTVGPQLMQAWMPFKINSHRFWNIWLLLVTGSNLWLSALLYCHMVKHYHWTKPSIPGWTILCKFGGGNGWTMLVLVCSWPFGFITEFCLKLIRHLNIQFFK